TLTVLWLNANQIGDQGAQRLADALKVNQVKDFSCLLSKDFVNLDYVKQFIFDTKTCLPNNIRLLVNYRLLEKATRNFTRNTTRNNYAKLNNSLVSKN
ncbi:unnamed protein product, partial [Rotaria magnacalcarata]